MKSNCTLHFSNTDVQINFCSLRVVLLISLLRLQLSEKNVFKNRQDEGVGAGSCIKEDKKASRKGVQIVCAEKTVSVGAE